MPTLAETTKPSSLPSLLTVHETATLLRTSRRAIYAMIERGQIPGRNSTPATPDPSRSLTPQHP